MITVERQLPRNSRIIRLVSEAAITPFVHDTADRSGHEDPTGRRSVAATSASGNVALICAIFALMP